MGQFASETIHSVWNDRQDLIYETLQVLVRDAGADETKLEVNWRISTIIANAKAVCSGSEPVYDTFLGNDIQKLRYP